MGASLSLTVTESNISQANNTSVVKAVLKIKATGETHNGYNQYGYITIDGTKYGFHHSFAKGTTTTLATKSKTVTHNADGSKSVTVKGYYETGVSPGNLSKSTTKTLTKITRQYTVAYNANNGSGAPGTQTKTYGVTLKLSTAKPTRAGYTFKGWATSAGGSVAYAAGANYTANAAITLYAVWQVITYNVAYNANGGSNAPDKQIKTHGKTLTLSSTVPIRSGYSFVGWGTASNATAAKYQPGGKYTANAAVTLYAIWSANYISPTVNSVNIYRCDANGEKRVSGTHVIMEFTWTTGINPGVSTYSTKVKVTYGSGTVWYAETTSTAKSATITLGPTEIEYVPNLAATITITDTKASSDNVTTRKIAIPDVGLAVDISPHEDNVTLFGVCDDDKTGLIVKGDIEGKDINAENIYAGNIGAIYRSSGYYTVPTAGVINVGPHITIPPGIYMIFAFWSFEGEARGAIEHALQVSYGIFDSSSNFVNYQYTRVSASNDFYVRLNVAGYVNPTTTTTLYAGGWDRNYNHPTAALCGIQAVRIR